MRGKKEPTGKDVKNSKCKKPGAGMSLASWRSSKEVSVAAAECSRGRVREMSLEVARPCRALEAMMGSLDFILRAMGNH